MFDNTWQENVMLIAGYIVPPIFIAMIALVIALYLNRCFDV